MFWRTYAGQEVEKNFFRLRLSLSLCRAGARYGVVLRFERERGEEAVRQSRNARKRASDSIGRPIPSISPLPIQSGVIRCEDFRASAGQFP